jgi:hypothetical protein
MSESFVDFPYASLARVAHVVSGIKIVLNKGSDDDIKLNQRFVIFGLGEEIVDPQTNRSLGRLEEVRGTVKVIHLQPKMATAESDKKVSSPKTVRRGGVFSAFGEEVTETTYTEPVDLIGVQVGDFARAV